MKLRFSQRPVELHGLARGLNGSHGVKVVVNPNNRQLVMLFEQQQVRVSITCNGGSESEKRNTPYESGSGSLPWESSNFEIWVQSTNRPVTYWFPGSNRQGIIGYADWSHLDDIITWILSGRPLRVIKKESI